MLIRRAVLDQIVAGTITVQFRRWNKPTVKTGGWLTTVVGMLAIGAVDVVDPGSLTDDDAAAAGYASVAALLADVRPEGTLFRIAVAPAGDDPRIALRNDDHLDDAELDAIAARLARYDRSSSFGAWTTDTLRLIADHPAVLAADLAEMVGRERAAFKNDVRKLKALGLTESLPVGYRLAPRGLAFLASRLRSTDLGPDATGSA